MEEPEESSPSESVAYGLLRQDIQQLVQEIRRIHQELRRVREHINQISQHIEMERSLRHNADAIQQRRMHTFMMKLSNLANEYLSDPADAAP